MFRRALLLATCVALPSVVLAQAPAKAPAKPDSAKPVMQHDMAGMKHDMAGMKHDMMHHGAMDSTAKAAHGAGHDMAQCEMHQAHMKMMAFYKAVMADSVIHARIRDTKALRDQHHEIDELMAKAPAHGDGGMPMDCPMMKKAKPAS